MLFYLVKFEYVGFQMKILRFIMSTGYFQKFGKGFYVAFEIWEVLLQAECCFSGRVQVNLL